MNSRDIDGEEDKRIAALLYQDQGEGRGGAEPFQILKREIRFLNERVFLVTQKKRPTKTQPRPKVLILVQDKRLSSTGIHS